MPLKLINHSINQLIIIFISSLIYFKDSCSGCLLTFCNKKRWYFNFFRSCPTLLSNIWALFWLTKCFIYSYLFVIYIYIYIRVVQKFLASLKKKNYSWSFLLWQHITTFYKARKTNSCLNFCADEVQTKVCDKSRIWDDFECPPIYIYIYIYIIHIYKIQCAYVYIYIYIYRRTPQIQVWLFPDIFL